VLCVGIVAHVILAKLLELKIILVLRIITSLYKLSFLEEWLLQDDCPVYFTEAIILAIRNNITVLI
jgi:hypothetical protein